MNPLPVLFANEKAYEKNNGVQVEWSNLTEKDIGSYTIERSANGTDFSPVTSTQPKSNQSDRADYSVLDPTTLSDVKYYRISAVELSGRIIYTKTLRVEASHGATSVALYPNPVVNHQLTVSFTGIQRGEYRLSVISVSGQQVYQKTLVIQGSAMTANLVLPAQIKPGIYSLLIKGLNSSESRSFLIQ
jgi:hypothetical protein